MEWRTIVLVGGMFPLGLAMEKSGAAGLVSSLIADTLGTLGPHITMTGITLIALLLTQSLHGAAVAVIMTPVALDTTGLLPITLANLAVRVPLISNDPQHWHNRSAETGGSEGKEMKVSVSKDRQFYFPMQKQCFC